MPCDRYSPTAQVSLGKAGQKTVLQFTSVEFKTFLRNWHIIPGNSPPYYSRSNGRAESAVNSMKKLIKGSWTAGTFDKAIWFAKAILLCRDAPRFGGKSPAKAVFGHPVRECLPPRVGNRSRTRERFHPTLDMIFQIIETSLQHSIHCTLRMESNNIQNVRTQLRIAHMFASDSQLYCQHIDVRSPLNGNEKPISSKREPDVQKNYVLFNLFYISTKRLTFYNASRLDHVVIQHPTTKSWATPGVIVEVGEHRDYMVDTIRLPVICSSADVTRWTPPSADVTQ